MSLEFSVVMSGQLGNNVCILTDKDTKETWIIDPSYNPEIIFEKIKQQGLRVTRILLTHGHFDHFAGINFLAANLPEKPQLALHRDDLELLRDGGGSKYFHMPVIPPDDPDFFLEDRQELRLGDSTVQVRLAPGHTSGSVIFYLPGLKTAVCGDVIFYHGIGRTDMPGGNFDTLVDSIRRQVFSLPPETRLIPGHGSETSVGEEMQHNPFLDL